MADRKRRQGRLDLEATEKAIRGSMHEVGGKVLERLANADRGYRGAQVKCPKGHPANFVEYRDKSLVTVLSEIEVVRAYYYCAQCRGGVIPKDMELDISQTLFSPGVRRMMATVGSKESFDEGRQDLEELAGIRVSTKEVERVSEATGGEVLVLLDRERDAAMSGNIVPIRSVPLMYIGIDGTGVPMVKRELEGRKGKEGQAHTREAKLGCVFTQTGVDEQGYPVRDEESTTYVGVIEDAKSFGSRIYAEAVRRGVCRAEKVIVLGDGASWIWGIADHHFHGATQIVDLYHARQHISDLARIVYGSVSAKSHEWIRMRYDELDRGEVEILVKAIRRLRPRSTEAKEALRREGQYFANNAERMRYAQFRRLGLFVGSGVVEAGCKILFGQRLKQSGMHWTMRGANSIIALRCIRLSGRWEEFYEMRSAS